MTDEDWIVPDWDAPPNVHARVTTRMGGVSEGAYAELNLGLHVGDSDAHVQHNRRLLTAALPGEPAWLTQVHGTAVACVDDVADAPCADAAFARRPRRVCAVMTADCLPVLFCDRDGGVVGVAHAGWRGLVDGVLEATVAAMNVGPERLFAWLGPAIGPAAFEVGSEVRERFLAHDPHAEQAFRPGEAHGKWMADIFTLARQRLMALGLASVQGGGRCTFSDAARFYSFRRDGVTGRFATLIWRD